MLVWRTTKILLTVWSSLSVMPIWTRKKYRSSSSSLYTRLIRIICRRLWRKKRRSWSRNKSRFTTFKRRLSTTDSTSTSKGKRYRSWNFNVSPRTRSAIKRHSKLNSWSISSPRLWTPLSRKISCRRNRRRGSPSKFSNRKNHSQKPLLKPKA